MAGEVSTIQSLKAVDAWIDVINANINGGVRTAFKSSRLKFSGSNVDISRAGNATSLPLQFPESGLTTANTVIDFSQGAVTASTENTHLAIQGEGFFLVASPDTIDLVGPPGGDTQYAAGAKFYLTRDGEFRTDANGYLRTSYGYYLVTADIVGGVPRYSTTAVGMAGSQMRPIYNDLDNPTLPTTANYNGACKLSEFLTGKLTTTINGSSWGAGGPSSLVDVTLGKQGLRFSTYGSTVYDIDYKVSGGATPGTVNTALTLAPAAQGAATILSKSLEASNASMTQSVPELSLAQKLFSALTKVLQTKQTNVDGVLNLVR
jgi:flagellar hook protein FlgE